MRHASLGWFCLFALACSDPAPAVAPPPSEAVVPPASEAPPPSVASEAPLPPPQSAAPSTDPPATDVAPAGELGCALPDGALVLSRERRRVFVGITSDVTWVAVGDDAPGLMDWLIECSQHDVSITVHGAHDPGVPQDGMPEWATSVLSMTHAEPGAEQCLPCWDAFGNQVAASREGCDC